MDTKQWELIRRCAAGEDVGRVPVALIVDSPWIPGYLGISTLDYLMVPEVWLEANLEVVRRFPGVIFLPGFWVEMGMLAEPSAFGCRLSFYHDRTPVAHVLGEDIGTYAGLGVPDPRVDGLMPVILNQYRRMEPRVRDAGHGIRVVAARGPLTVATHLMGVSAFLLAMKLQPKETHALLRVTATLVRTWLEAQAEVLPEVGGVMVLDDIAGFISPKDYLEFAHPYLAEVYGAFPGALKIFHNDTNNPVSYGHVGELGVQIFNFTHLQSIAEVRRRVGPGVCLMGNVPPLEVLVQGDAERVRESGRRCVREHGGAAGLLLSAGGGVSPGTPGENIEALLAAVLEESDDA